MDVPSHVFPVSYPSSTSTSYSYDPFPCKTRNHSLPMPVWRRTPATSLPVRSTPDSDDFISLFAAKLVLREASSKKQGLTTTQDHPWFSAIHTTVSSAPHPALIRPPASFSLVSTLPMVSAPSSRCHSFSSLTLYSPSPSNSPTYRKVAPLAKRIPRSTSPLHRYRNPTLSAQSLSPSNSRTPSLSSIASSTSSSSNSSSRPSTPNCSPASLSRHTSLPYVSEPQDTLQMKGSDLI